MRNIKKIFTIYVTKLENIKINLIEFLDSEIKNTFEIPNKHTQKTSDKVPDA